MSFYELGDHLGRYRAVGAVAPFEKQMVGPPRRRGPKIQARMRRFFTGRLRRASRTAATSGS
jgi:hypothetical protein